MKQNVRFVAGWPWPGLETIKWPRSCSICLGREKSSSRAEPKSDNEEILKQTIKMWPLAEEWYLMERARGLRRLILQDKRRNRAAKVARLWPSHWDQLAVLEENQRKAKKRAMSSWVLEYAGAPSSWRFAC